MESSAPKLMKCDRLYNELLEIGRDIRDRGRHATTAGEMAPWLASYTNGTDAVNYLGMPAACEAAFTGYCQRDAEIAEADKQIAAQIEPVLAGRTPLDLMLATRAPGEMTLREYTDMRRTLEISIAHFAERELAKFTAATSHVVTDVELRPVSLPGQPVTALTCRVDARL